MSEFGGRIVATDNGVESSLIIPCNGWSIMVLSDDSCGVGKGKLIRHEICVYKDHPNGHINQELFGMSTVEGTTENIEKALEYCKNNSAVSGRMESFNKVR